MSKDGRSPCLLIPGEIYKATSAGFHRKVKNVQAPVNY